MSVTIGTLMAYIGADTSDLKKAEKDVKKSTDTMDLAFSSLGKTVIAAFSIGAVMAGFKRELENGIRFVEEYNMTVIDIAASLTNASKAAREGGDVGAVYKQAKEYAEQLVPIIERLDARTVASGRDLTEMYSAFIRGGAEINLMNVEQQDAFVGIANSMKALLKDQFNERQINQEISSLMMGRITMSEKLGKTLKMMDPDIEKHVQQWKTTGELLPNIIKLLPGYAAATADIQDQWGAVKSSLETIHTQILRKGMLGVYKDLVDWGNKLKSVLMDQNGQLTQQSQMIVGAIAGGWVTTKNTISTIYNLLRPFFPALKFMGELVSASAKGWGMIMAMLKPISKIVGAIGEAMAENIVMIAKILNGDFKGAKESWARGGQLMGEALAVNLRDEFLKEYDLFEKSLEAGKNLKFDFASKPEGAGGTLTDEEKKELAKKQKEISDFRKKLEADDRKKMLGPDNLKMNTPDFGKEYFDQARDIAEFQQKLKTEALQAMLTTKSPLTQDPKMFDEYLAENKRVSEVIAETWVRAFSTIEDQFADTFMMAMDGDFDSILDSWGRMLQQMVAKWVASQAMMALFGEAGNSPNVGGLAGSLIGSIGGFITGMSMPAASAASAGVGAMSMPMMPNVTGYADGGWITEPISGIGMTTGKRYSFGENEAEMVTPISDMKGGSSSGGSTNNKYEISIVAMDTASFDEFTRRNPQAIIGPIEEALNRGNSSLRNSIQRAS